MSLEDRTAAHLETCNLGFIKGTVVTKRSGNKFIRTNPNYWGIILDTIVYEHDFQNKMYAPCRVGWVNEPSNPINYYWADELIMVCIAPDSADLEMIENGE